jgi:ankyrin repeat protein
MSETYPLKEAIRDGTLDSVRSLLDAGADVRYVRPKGYTAVIDAMFSRSIEGVELMALFELLIERGADIDAESDYGESALSVASRMGRFDVVWHLLKAGAKPDPLDWNTLDLITACGPIESMKSRPLEAHEIEQRDRWGRTPFLLAVIKKDVEKARLLLEAGANLADRSHDGSTAVMFAINDHPSMLEWLLEKGADPNIVKENGDTPLMRAASDGAEACVRLLLRYGADPLAQCMSTSVISCASTLPIARLLVAAGADLNDINQDVKDQLTGRKLTNEIECELQEYHSAKHRAFGTSNPERMNHAFWVAMVNARGYPHHARAQFDDDTDDGAIWCNDRFGQSFTELPDGRCVEIGGEHEDFYDPDFCIYNDVVVHLGNGVFDIFGYPKEVFPPTDFHTATFVDGSIYIIGSIGYAGEREYGNTPVYRLDTESFSIELLTCGGEAPGWIHNHQAKAVGKTVLIHGGKILDLVDGKEASIPNELKYELDIESRIWSRVE